MDDKMKAFAGLGILGLISIGLALSFAGFFFPYHYGMMGVWHGGYMPMMSYGAGYPGYWMTWMPWLFSLAAITIVFVGIVWLARNLPAAKK